MSSKDKVGMIVNLLTFDEVYNEIFYQLTKRGAIIHQYFNNTDAIYAQRENPISLRRILLDIFKWDYMVPSSFILELVKYLDVNPPAPPNYLSEDNYYYNLSDDILINIAVERDIPDILVGTGEGLKDTLYELDRADSKWINRPPFENREHLLAYLSTFGFIFDDNFVEYLVP